MEKSSEYKSAVYRIKALEQRIDSFHKALKECEEAGTLVERLIEDHFEKCLNVLAARKAILMAEVEQQVSNYKQRVKAAQAKLVTSIEAGKQSLKGASMVHAVDQNAANIILKGLATLVIQHIERVTISTDLPITLFDTIQKHGKGNNKKDLFDTHFEAVTILQENPHEIARFAKPEMVTTFVGTGQGYKDGNALEAKFNYPFGICLNHHDECFYITDVRNNSIRKVTQQGNVSTFITGLNGPQGIAIFCDDFFVTNEGSHSVSKISSQGKAQVFAGSGKPGSVDGVGANASFNCPSGIAIDQKTGNMFVCDNENHVIRKITSRGEVSTFAGSQQGFKDGNLNAAMFNHPCGICFDSTSNSLIVCDFTNNKLRQVYLNGEVSTLCTINSPTCVETTASHTFIVSALCHKLFKVTLNKDSQKYEAKLLVGAENPGRADGKPGICKFNYTRGIAVHEASHSCLVIDQANHSIRKVIFY